MYIITNTKTDMEYRQFQPECYSIYDDQTGIQYRVVFFVDSTKEPVRLRLYSVHGNAATEMASAMITFENFEALQFLRQWAGKADLDDAERAQVDSILHRMDEKLNGLKRKLNK